jgi:competence protein ComEC
MGGPGGGVARAAAAVTCPGRAIGPGGGIALLALAWIAGAAAQLQLAQTWSAAWAPGSAGVGVVAVGAALLALLGLARRPAPVIVAAAVATLAFAATDWRAQQRLDDALAPALEGQDLVLTGVIAELPRISPIGVRFAFEVEEAQRAGAPVAVPRRVMLGWTHGYDGEVLLARPTHELRAGDRWRLPVRLKRPHGAMNPHGFDAELWMFEHDLGASGTVRPGAERLAEAVAHPVERLRQHIRDAVLVRVADGSAAGVIAALAVGDQASIGRDDWEVFRATGVAHLVSISGLHVTMFAWLAGGLVGALWRRSERLMLTLPAPTAALLGGLAGAFGYALLAGFGVPAQRTVLMVAAVVVLRLLGWRWPPLLMLLAVAAVVTAADPWALLQPGFWLSFVAVAMLLVAAPDQAGDGVAPGRAGLRARLRAAWRTEVVATVGLAPLTMVFFQQVSLVGFFANLIAIPVVTLVVTPLALLGVLVPPLWLGAAAVVHGLQALLGALAALPLAVWAAAAAPAWGVAAGLLGGALLVLPLPWRLKALGLPLLLPLLAPPVERPGPGTFELLAADVGQGNAVLVRTASHLLLYDAGPAYSPEADAGERVLLPLLRARGEVRIDLLVLSHRDADHVGGAGSLLAAVDVAASTSSLADDHPLRQRLPAHRRCDAGQAWQWDGVRFEVLHPRPEDHARTLSSNGLSCVLQVTGADGRRALLAGDIEAAQEAALVERAGPALRSDWLLVPHHGSRTSSTAAFVDAVRPEVGVVQAAYRSRFGHPAPDVLARHAERGVEVVRSDRCGAHAWPAGRCERSAHVRYWHWRPVDR